jgi:hypothetical protein
MQRKVEKPELTDLRASLTNKLKSKADISELQAAVTSQQKDTSRALTELKDELKGAVRRIDESTHASISKRATQADLETVAKTRLEIT